MSRTSAKISNSGAETLNSSAPNPTEGQKGNEVASNGWGRLRSMLWIVIGGYLASFCRPNWRLAAIGVRYRWTAHMAAGKWRLIWSCTNAIAASLYIQIWCITSKEFKFLAAEILRASLAKNWISAIAMCQAWILAINFFATSLAEKPNSDAWMSNSPRSKIQFLYARLEPEHSLARSLA